ncbi:hypothetical protein [Streptomyces sp. NPDC002845]
MEHSVSSIPYAPDLPLALWWVIAIAVSVGFTTLYWSVAANRAQRIMAITGLLVGVFGTVLFGAANEFHIGQLLPMYSGIITGLWLGGIGHPSELRELNRITAEKGPEHARWSGPLAAQMIASLTIFLGLGIWFAASA